METQDDDLFPVFPSKWKYVYVGEVWCQKGQPTSTKASPARVLPLGLSRMWDSLSGTIGTSTD
jgi:hypothetical protein